MLTTRFSVQGSALKLLCPGERGTITRLTPLHDKVSHTLKAKGFTLGQMITLEEHFPRFVVRIGNQRHTLDELTKNAIYVRIVNG